MKRTLRLVSFMVRPTIWCLGARCGIRFEMEGAVKSSVCLFLAGDGAVLWLQHNQHGAAGAKDMGQAFAMVLKHAFLRLSDPRGVHVVVSHR